MKSFLISILFFLLPFFANALYETLGRELSCEYLGQGDSLGINKYQIRLNVYKDCESFFHPEQSFNVYLGDNLFFVGLTFYHGLPLDSVTYVENPDFFCTTTSSSLCIKKYSYSTIIEFPIANQRYFIGFQSCCRDDFINVIAGGNGNGSGSTHFIEISEYAQQIGNSFPVFSGLLITTVCQGEEFSVSSEATDMDGHQLVYKLCSPLLRTIGNTSFSPVPLPPYDSIIYLSPYSYDYPLGQNAQFSIDPNTGIMTGTPDIVGRFLVGVCVEEYENGQLLSTVFKDFPINVVECTPQVTADISNSDDFNNDTYIFNLCNQTQLTLQNQSTDTNYINNLFWVFDINNQLDTFYEWNPTINFPTNGTYTGQLFINPTEECSDTANIIVNVNELLQANFEISYDTCIGGEVSFTNQSISEGGAITDWFWDFGDSTTSDAEHPLHQYQQSGSQTASLIITNEYFCKDTVIQNFDWLPAPPIIVVAPNTFAGCSPLSVFFENRSTPVDSTYEVVWDFGNGDVSTAISPSYIYEDIGVFDISVSITSPIGCEIDTTFLGWIKVTPAPRADFYWLENEVTDAHPEVHFIDQSTEALTWQWSTNQQVFSYEQNPSYALQDTGYQSITLTIFDQYECTDSLTKIIDVVPVATYFLP
ncbi:MAG TPA: hypothetical protein ENJ53_08110, partial [Phaeodactylibacter sp.]|nr:hypothetical protein [Phaeodactylibacter sp.]